MTQKQLTISDDDPLKDLALRLGLHGIAARWDEYRSQPWLPRLLEVEEAERQKLSLDRRIGSARLGRFKLMADFDWAWPQTCDRELVEELFSFAFLKEAANVVLVGPNGTGKTMIAKNLAYQAVLKGTVARFVTASTMLNDLSGAETGMSLDRRFRKYARPRLLVVDEVGYLSYNTRHADLLYEVVSRRYQETSTVITTNRAFGNWNEIFPNASCVVTLVDRLVHRSEIVKLDGESYRFKEARERAQERSKGRRGKARLTPRDLGLSGRG